MKTMNYEEFRKIIVPHMAEHLGIDVSQSDRIVFYNDGYHGDTQEDRQFIEGTNDRYGHSGASTLVGDFILVKSPKTETGGYCCRFSVRYLYEEFQINGWERINSIVDENIQGAAKVNVNVLNIMADYEQIKEKLIVCLRNISKAKVRYRDSIFQKIDDMAMILYIIVQDDGCGNRMIAHVPRVAATSWRKTDDEILAEALKNTAILSPPRLYCSIEDCMTRDRHVGEFMAPTSSIRSIPAGPFAATLTAIPQTDGAVSLYYPGVQERLSVLAGGDYYIVFTGTSEARIHPGGTISPNAMRNALLDTNKRYPEEMLTNNIYFYDSKRKSLKKV